MPLSYLVSSEVLEGGQVWSAEHRVRVGVCDFGVYLLYVWRVQLLCVTQWMRWL